MISTYRGNVTNLLGISLLTMHALLLATAAVLDSPTTDEYGHLAAGVVQWQYGDFRCYEVNPPLVRMIAALPCALVSKPMPFVSNESDPRFRTELQNTFIFCERAGPNLYRYVTFARWMCIPFSLLGAAACWCWATRLYGPWAGLLGLFLWVFSPSTLGHGHLITMDIPAAALNITVLYLFWRWLHEPDWPGALVWGVAAGIALLTKFTLVLLPALLLLFGTAYLVFSRAPIRQWFHHNCLMILGFATMLLTVNIGYGFAGTGRRLEDFHFGSMLFTGAQFLHDAGEGNRWRGTLIGKLPIPLPSNYLTGIDAQQWDFERGMLSYLNGVWRRHGWWYYYAFGLLIKEPLPMWIVLGAALLITIRQQRPLSHRFAEWMLLVTAMAYLILVSSKTGFTNHVRYAFVLLPPLWIYAARIGLADSAPLQWLKLAIPQRAVTTFVAVPLSWQIVSVGFCYPHVLSYFSEIVGGPLRGGYYLLDSNIDWNQDIYRLKRYMAAHRVATRPLKISNSNVLGLISISDPDLTLIEPDYWQQLLNNSAYVDVPVRLTSLFANARFFTCLQRRGPIARIGYSIHIYRIDQETLNCFCQSRMPDVNGNMTRGTE